MRRRTGVQTPNGACLMRFLDSVVSKESTTAEDEGCEGCGPWGLFAFLGNFISARVFGKYFKWGHMSIF